MCINGMRFVSHNNLRAEHMNVSEMCSDSPLSPVIFMMDENIIIK